MKPKVNRGAKVGKYDNCQTPPYALEPLLPYINPVFSVWECAAGKGTLARELLREGFNVFATDTLDNVSYNYGMPCLYGDFFTIRHPDRDYTIVTNPPYSLKYQWLRRCLELGRPFALLLPVEILGTQFANEVFSAKDIRIMFLSPRVDFYMPDKGYEGGGAQFPTAWFTFGLSLPKETNYARLDKPKRSELAEYWRKAFNE
jgi:hypothetical protein